MTFLKEESRIDSGRVWYNAWYYLTNPDSGANTVAWTVTNDYPTHTNGNCSHIARLMEYQDVDQTNPFGATANVVSAQGSSSNPSVTITPNASSNLIVASCIGGGDDTGPMTDPTNGGTWTQRFSEESGGGQPFNDCYAEGWDLATGGTSAVTVNPTLASSDDWGIIAVELKLSSTIVEGSPSDLTADIEFDPPTSAITAVGAPADLTADNEIDTTSGESSAVRGDIDDPEIDVLFDAPLGVIVLTGAPDDLNIDNEIDGTGGSLAFNVITPASRRVTVPSEGRVVMVS